MITNKELQAITLSPTKADFYQLWNELMETANKLSERWKPSETNESDPGVVLLKVLCGTADKLNYTIAKNILEAFMPSAAQEESMRKLCSMLGYDMKYYQSATTDVTISYANSESTIAEKLAEAGQTDTSIIIPAFTNIKNTDADINYFTLEPKTLDDYTNKTTVVECMEGEVCLCGDDTNNIITVDQLDDNYRYYLPETQIAENGIFITNIANEAESTAWDRVTNLNVQAVGAKCFKFGFNSVLQMPYIQFPEDISNIIEDGLIIRYTRTNGINGNISYNTLSTLEVPTSLSNTFTSTDFAVKNAAATNNGRNKETIDDAYNNYKKTIGTFDTLVTCRDYINKIYQMTTDDANTTPLVSNINVSDIRDDINKAITLCTFNQYGIVYVDKSLATRTTKQADLIYETVTSLPSPTAEIFNKVYKCNDAYYKCVKTTKEPTTYEFVEITPDMTVDYNIETKEIESFDLVIYPFTNISGVTTKDAYLNSFKYSVTNKSEIEENLKAYKTLAHNFVYPKNSDIVLIKNYLKLKAKITTNAKVNAVEEAIILNNIYTAIYDTFNSRNLDFGEEIPFDIILNTIQNADTRIKNVALDEPILYTRFCGADGNETDSAITYNRLALRNVLAGRIALFDYNTDFKTEFNEKAYGGSVEPIYPAPTDTRYITSLESNFKINTHDFTGSADENYLLLNENEVLQFRAPNFKTKITYPAYVNYFLHLERPDGEAKVIAKNTDYRLKENEWLAINYTPSTTADDGTTSSGEPINIVYQSGTIIRPNFELTDSTVWKKANHSPSKTSGYDFTGYTNVDATINNGKSGMFAFDTNEQLEIRDVVEIILDEQATNIYWERNDEDTLELRGDKIYFNWNEDKDADNIYHSYTLKEGEYLYYTDASKIDLAYYGNGTKITRANASFDLYKIKQNTESLAEKITNEGLLAALPWVAFDCSKNNIVLTEYQYINLTTGDKLYKLQFTNAVSHAINEIDTTDGWTKIVTDADWKYSSDSNENLEKIPKIVIDEDKYKWHARTILNINMSPVTTQALRYIKRTVATAWQTNDTLTINYNTGSSKTLSQESLTDNALMLKANYIVQSSAGSSKILSSITDFKIETFAEDTSDNYKKIKTYLNNFGANNWTKITFSKDLSKFNLNINLHGTDHALIMFYDLDKSTTSTDHPYIQLVNDPESSSPSFYMPKICNAAGSLFTTNGWWAGSVVGNKYYLRNGINIIEVSNSCTMVVNANSTVSSTVIFSNFDTVKYTNNNFVINPRIVYKAIEKPTATSQILYDIRNIDPDYSFYYNTLIDNSTAIDLNTNITDPTDADYESLASPATWYDYNNINNKFVISEIDADYLSTGITLTSSSRK